MTSPKHRNQTLYNQVKRDATKKFKSPSSVYRSAWIGQEYKKRGGTYDGKKPKKSESGLGKWFTEEWVQVEGYLKNRSKIQCGSSNKTGKACRPLKRINTKTPLTIPELLKLHDKDTLLKIARQKQRDMAGRLSWKLGKFYPSKNRSAPRKSPKRKSPARSKSPRAPLKKPTGKWSETKPLYKPVKSSRESKKGMVYVMKNGSKRLIHFGDASMSDFTIHKDKDRRANYLKRSGGIRDKNGKLTANDKNSANYYSRNYLW
jgi:hypothetical protein